MVSNSLFNVKVRFVVTEQPELVDGEQPADPQQNQGADAANDPRGPPRVDSWVLAQPPNRNYGQNNCQDYTDRESDHTFIQNPHFMQAITGEAIDVGGR